MSKMQNTLSETYEFFKSVGYEIINPSPGILLIFSRIKRLMNNEIDLDDIQFHLLIQKELSEGNLKKQENPNKYVVLSHDIDHVQSYSILSRIRLLYTLNQWSPRYLFFFTIGFLKAIVFRIFNIKPWVNLKSWIDLEKQYKSKATYFFLGEPFKGKRHFMDSTYLFTDKVYHNSTIQNEVRKLEESTEVGLHGGWYSSLNEEELITQRNNLVSITNKKQITSQRFHHLKKSPEFVKNLRKVGFVCDSSIGYNDKLPDYNSILPPFKFQFGEEYIYEFPITIQDIALVKCFKSYEACKIEIDKIFQFCLDNNIAPTILWHNNYNKESIYFKLYEYILKSIKANNLQGVSINEYKSKIWE